MTERRAIFVTGGASGIGRAIARRFAAEGWFVGVADVDEPGMVATLALLPEGCATKLRLDVTDRTAWDRALDQFAEAAGGRIDVVANNAGIALGGDLIESSAEEIDRIIAVNLTGAIYGAQAAHRWLRQTAPGSCLLNTGSAAGLYGSPGTTIYSATKFGVRALTEALDAEWAADGIRVCSLMPSYIDTPLLDRPPNARHTVDMRQLVLRSGREITPVAEVAEAAWQAVMGDRLHWIVGKTARQLAFAIKWMPARLRKRMRGVAAERRRAAREQPRPA